MPEGAAVTNTQQNAHTHAHICVQYIYIYAASPTPPPPTHGQGHTGSPPSPCGPVVVLWLGCAVLVWIRMVEGWFRVGLELV